MALLEAMSIGMPCIVSDVGANKDMIEDQGGIVVDINNSGQIVRAIHKMQSREVRKKMSEWNIWKVKKYYSTDAFFEKMKRIYEQVAGGE